ncbi:hypothetical protein [Microvirga pakistanensis]|uniref:hypothetical protein n=1 Tax=Microvirga pakistanensis TaxID=1682650 RepID=UPI00106A7952|nr:hypothetical protein [Microvirga pakistanensis]
MVERVDRRIMAAIRAVDAVTGAAIQGLLNIRGPGLAFQRTRSGAYAIVEAEGLEGHIAAFDAPPTTPVSESRSFAFEIEDPAGRYLPAAGSIRLPRRWDPANDVRDLMVPIEVSLPPSAARDLSPSWASVMAHVVDQDGQPVRGALVEVLPTSGDAARLGWSITNNRGQALVAVPGLPSLREVENDPTRTDDDQVVTAETATDIRAQAYADRRWPVDPVDLAAGGAGIRMTSETGVQLTAGRMVSVALTIDLS